MIMFLDKCAAPIRCHNNHPPRDKQKTDPKRSCPSIPPAPKEHPFRGTLSAGERRADAMSEAQGPEGPHAERGAKEALAGLMVCDLSARAPFTCMIELCSGRTCRRPRGSTASTTTARRPLGASHRYVYLPCSRKKAQWTSNHVRGGAAAPPPTSLAQLPLLRVLC